MNWWIIAEMGKAPSLLLLMRCRYFRSPLVFSACTSSLPYIQSVHTAPRLTRYPTCIHKFNIRIIMNKHHILMPATEHGYFVASWWRTPLRHSQKLLLASRFYFQQTSAIHAPVGKRKGCYLSGRSPVPIADSFYVTTVARKQRVKFTRN
jgi:hypothetical protein